MAQTLHINSYNNPYAQKVPVKRIISTLGIILPLASCAPAEDTGQSMLEAWRDNLRATSNTIEKWVTTHPGHEPPQAIASSYCYHSLQDVLCYRQPMPGWENRLIAYQGTNALPPEPAIMQLLPKQPVEADMLPANRVANSKPVFSTMPVSVKEGGKSSDQPQVIDSSHEQLPDPALAPQL